MVRVLFAGGGTGGHLYPAVAMYERLRELPDGVEALFVGARGGVEEAVLRRLGLPHALLRGRGLRGASLARRVLAPVTFAVSVADAFGVLRSFDPDVVVGTGGFASASAVVAAVIARRPVVLQEQNSVPGLVNRRLARFARLVLLSYPGSAGYLPAGVRCEVVGNPLRRMPAVDRAEAARVLGLRPDRATVLVTGGSRGAHRLNTAAAAAVPRLVAQRGVQCLLLTGAADEAMVRDAVVGAGDAVRVLAYLDDMHLAYALADVAVARAGASSLFELARAGVPAVLVPYPHAADDHQARNAAPLAECGGAVVVEDARFDGDAFYDAVGALVDDATRRRRMAEAVRAWAPADAAGVAAQRIVATARPAKKKTESAPRARGRLIRWPEVPHRTLGG